MRAPIVDPDGSEPADPAAARSLLGAAVLAGRFPFDHANHRPRRWGNELLLITYAESVRNRGAITGANNLG